MSTGLQRVCPSCAELSPPDSHICLECGAWLVEPRKIEGKELEAIHADWHVMDRPRRVDNPKQRQQENAEWDEAREREEARRTRNQRMWQQRRERWARGDTARVPGSIPPRKEG